jgi:uncharacterized protein YrzB (UPF0473 family)
MAEKTLVDRLLDVDDTKPLKLFDDDGKPAEFEQVAVLMYQEVPYIILHPADGKESEVLIFELFEDTEESLALVADIKLAQSILDEYKKKIKELKVKQPPKASKS